MEWVKKKISNDAVKQLASRYKIDLLSASIIIRRSINNDRTILYYLDDKELFLHNPFLLTDMDEAVERIIQATTEKEEVMIFGDRDTDGLTAEALMAGYLIKNNIKPLLLMPLGDEPYGLQCSSVEIARDAGVTLIICVDNGASAHEAVALANSYGIDTVIFDHHDKSPQELNAYAYVNPKRDDSYPNRELSSSALMLKALFALNYAKSPLYKRAVCLLNVVELADGMLSVTASRVINIKIGTHAVFTVGAGSAQNDLFLRFIEGSPLLMYHADKQIELLASAFGAEVFAEDLSLILAAKLGSAAKMSLQELTERSSMMKFNDSASVMDALFYLYKLSIFECRELLADYYGAFDLATIGLLADMMALEDENRIIIKMGLHALNHPRREPLILLFNHLRLLDNNITAKSVGWRISPIINASGRMGQADKMLKFLLGVDPLESEALLNELDELNSNRRKLSDSWWDKIKTEVRQSKAHYGDRLIFVYNQELPRGITGLLASRLSRIDPESLVIMVGGRLDGSLVGSLRSSVPGLISLFFKQAGHLFLDHGGHDKAGGFSLLSKNLPLLKKQLSMLVTDFPGKEDKNDKMHIDAELSEEHLSLNVLDVVKRFEPYGQGFAPLLFATRRVTVASLQLIGKMNEHIKLSLLIEGINYPALWWSAADKITLVTVDKQIDLLYHVVPDSDKSAGFYLDIQDIRVIN